MRIKPGQNRLEVRARGAHAHSRAPGRGRRHRGRMGRRVGAGRSGDRQVCGGWLPAPVPCAVRPWTPAQAAGSDAPLVAQTW